MNDEHVLTHTAFLEKAPLLKHNLCKETSELYNIIKDGDINRIPEAKRLLFFRTCSSLSENPTRSQQYLFIANISVISCFAMEGGMAEKDALNLCTYYIQQTDHCTTIEEIHELYEKALETFITHVHELQNSPVYSKPIVSAIDYIYDHLHYNITVEQLAKHVGLSASYFSFLFKKEVGETIASYIRKMKIKAAKNMLLNTNFSSHEISSYLAFSSQSHFIRIFKQEVGITPKEFRDTYYTSKTE